MPIQQPRPYLSKIPGELPKSPPDVYVKDVNKLTKFELIEIKGRQEKLLANKYRISKLPDKGKRIQEFYEKILKELAQRDQIENAAKLFSELNIASKGQTKLTNLEWTGKYDSTRGEIILDSDDDEESNPLKIIAQSRNLEKKVKYIQPEKLLITEQDLKEIESFKTESIDEDTVNDVEPIVEAELVNIDIKSKIDIIKSKSENKLNLTESSGSKTSSTNSLNLEPHVLYLFDKGVDNLPQTEKFKPFKTTKTDVHDPEKEMLRKPIGKHWEITAATPPSIQHAGAKVLSLQDSVELQFEYLAKLKELQEKQAEERLQAKTARLKSMEIRIPEENPRKVKEFFGTHRYTTGDDNGSSDSDIHNEGIDSDEGVRDDEEERGGVSYVVYK